jgi:hypothetical protein
MPSGFDLERATVEVLGFDSECAFYRLLLASDKFVSCQVSSFEFRVSSFELDSPANLNLKLGTRNSELILRGVV